MEKTISVATAALCAAASLNAFLSMKYSEKASLDAGALKLFGAVRGKGAQEIR